MALFLRTVRNLNRDEVAYKYVCRSNIGQPTLDGWNWLSIIKRTWNLIEIQTRNCHIYVPFCDRAWRAWRGRRPSERREKVSLCTVVVRGKGARQARQATRVAITSTDWNNCWTLPVRYTRMTSVNYRTGRAALTAAAVEWRQLMRHTR